MSGNERRILFDHGPVKIVLVPLQPPRAAVLDRAEVPALVELGEEAHGVLAVLEVRLVKPQLVAVGD
jgi:hypothetical protein